MKTALQARGVRNAHLAGSNGTQDRPHAAVHARPTRMSHGGAQSWNDTVWTAWSLKCRLQVRANLVDKDVSAYDLQQLETFVPDHDQQVRQLCDGGLPDVDMCVLDDEPPSLTVTQEATSRGRWLLGLLLCQSLSSVVLDRYAELLRDHLVVTLFLTMLVGAGGNAGNQSAIKVIRELATGVLSPTWPSALRELRQQAAVGFLLGGGLAAGGFVRVYATNHSMSDATAISLSLYTIVMASVVLGTLMPFALTRAGVDPANAGTSIQVVMDILGVAITCATCNMLLVQLAHTLT